MRNMPSITLRHVLHAGDISTTHYNYIAKMFRLSVDDARVSSRLAAHFSRLRLECILEELRVYLTKTPLDTERAHFEDQHTPPARHVCVAAMGLFDFEVRSFRQFLQRILVCSCHWRCHCGIRA